MLTLNQHNAVVSLAWSTISLLKRLKSLTIMRSKLDPFYVSKFYKDIGCHHMHSIYQHTARPTSWYSYVNSLITNSWNRMWINANVTYILIWKITNKIFRVRIARKPIHGIFNTLNIDHIIEKYIDVSAMYFKRVLYCVNHARIHTYMISGLLYCYPYNIRYKPHNVIL